MDDAQLLVCRAQDGDERAARQLFDQFNLRTYRLALGLLGDEADAEEVAQDALTYALLNITRYRADLSSFSTWLHTITVSRARDKRRRKILPSIPKRNEFSGKPKLLRSRPVAKNSEASRPL